MTSIDLPATSSHRDAQPVSATADGRQTAYIETFLARLEGGLAHASASAFPGGGVAWLCHGEA
jgi:hypothetical protein